MKSQMAGGVDGASRARSEYHRNLRDDARGLGVSAEDVSIPVEGVHSFLNAGPARVVDLDERTPRAHGEVHGSADLRRMHLAQRAAQNREILGGEVDEVAVDLPRPVTTLSPA